jgi:hypothetical protein
MPLPDDIQQASSDRNTSPAISNDSSDGFDLDDLLDNLANYEEGQTVEDVVPGDVLMCWTPCGPSGSRQTPFQSASECPDGFTSEEPDCSFYEELLAAVEASQEQVEDAQEQAEEVQDETDEILSGGSGGMGGGIPYPPAGDTQQAGFLNLSRPVIYGGIALAAVIAFFATRKK